MTSNYKLPGWLKDALPPLSTPVEISYRDGNYFALNPDGTEEKLSDDISESYYNIDRQNVGIIFADSVYKELGINKGELITTPTSDGMHRVLFSSTDEDSLFLLESA
ncbi:MAG: hypothetical protein FWD05_14010 [Oscillospiraceae bacterium]|nr:hypothetical protein [Oscillospiraceae bacterium]